MQKKSQNIHLINNHIKCQEVLLIISEADKKILKTEEAMKIASDKGLDLVQVSTKGSSPVVCKLMDYGKFLFEKKKNHSTSKSKVKKTSLKEIKFRPSTDIGDYNIKLKKLKALLLKEIRLKLASVLEVERF